MTLAHEVHHMTEGATDSLEGHHLPPFDRPSFLGQPGPASIRYNNPGAMWPGPSSRRFGAIGEKPLHDGLGQGNKIAIFDDAIDGASAFFDLLSRAYSGLTVQAAIAKWSGGNNVGSYLSMLRHHAGVAPDEMISRDKLANPEWAVPFVKAMAWHEAGQEYPLADEHWRRAHADVFAYNVVKPSPPQSEINEAMKKSRKYSVAGFWKWLLTFLGISSPVTWEGTKAGIAAGSEIAQTVQTLAADYGFLIFAGVCISAALVLNWFQMLQRDDYEEGRYTPSGWHK